MGIRIYALHSLSSSSTHQRRDLVKMIASPPRDIMQAVIVTMFGLLKCSHGLGRPGGTQKNIRNDIFIERGGVV